MLLLSPRMTPEEYEFALRDEAFAQWQPVPGKAQFSYEYDGILTVYQKLEFMGALMQGFYQRFREQHGQADGRPAAQEPVQEAAQDHIQAPAQEHI